MSRSDRVLKQADLLQRLTAVSTTWFWATKVASESNSLDVIQQEKRVAYNAGQEMIKILSELKMIGWPDFYRIAVLEKLADIAKEWKQAFNIRRLLDAVNALEELEELDKRNSQGIKSESDRPHSSVESAQDQRDPQGTPEKQNDRNHRLADAAIEAHQRAKRSCGQFHPENNKECIHPVYGRTCIDCPMEWVAEIEEALRELVEEG